MLKNVLFLSVFVSLSAQAQNLSCPQTYKQLLSCHNTQESIDNYQLPQVAVDDYLLCANEKEGHLALVMNQAPSAKLEPVLYADGQGFGRNGFEIFTNKNPEPRGVMLLPQNPPVFRVSVVEDNDETPSAASDFECN